MRGNPEETRRYRRRREPSPEQGGAEAAAASQRRPARRLWEDPHVLRWAPHPAALPLDRMRGVGPYTCPRTCPLQHSAPLAAANRLQGM